MKEAAKEVGAQHTYMNTYMYTKPARFHTTIFKKKEINVTKKVEEASLCLEAYPALPTRGKLPHRQQVLVLPGAVRKHYDQLDLSWHTESIANSIFVYDNIRLKDNTTLSTENSFHKQKKQKTKQPWED